ncbi:MAG: rod shape-determining protein MreC [Chloroflexi bacterium]|nr:rod shape-determining protein MreC [Chloroflexota bacterium]
MRQSSSRALLPLVLAIVAILLLVFHETGLLAPVEAALHYVLDPLQRVGSGLVGSDGGGVFQGLREAQTLREEVARLQEQVDALTVENVRLREFEAEVLQLRALLSFVSEYPIEAPLGAEVIGRHACDVYPCADVISADPNPYLRYITINVGAQQGVEVGMPVVSGGAALVGRVQQVAARTSRVQLITDSDSSIAAVLQASRASGLVAGQPDGALHLDYVSQDEEVNEGDVVLTSGLGGTLPKGLIIGQVASVERVDYEMFVPIVVRPALDFSRLEIVMVITRFEAASAEELTEEAP